MLKNCFSLPKLLYFLRTSTYFNLPALLEKYDKTVRDGVSKVCNVNFGDISSTQLALPAEMGGLGVLSASLALPGFLASAFGASDFPTTIFCETFEDVSSTKPLVKLSLTNEQKVLSMELRKAGHNLSTPKPPTLLFLEWMTNVRNFLILIKANSGLNG